MFKVLEENVLLRQVDKWVSTTAILSTCSGGKRVDFMTADGAIIKSQPFCRTEYGYVTKKGDGFGEEVKEEKTKMPSFSDPEFMNKAGTYTKKLSELGLEEMQKEGSV